MTSPTSLERGKASLSRRAVTPGFLLVLLLASPSLEAASLEVLAAAAQRGNYGLRVTVGSLCTSPQDQVVQNQTVTGPTTVEGCRSVASSATTINSGGVTFRAGHRIVLGDGFVVQSAARFVAEVEGTLLPDAFLEDRTLDGEPHYAAGFFVNFGALTLGDNDRFDLFTGLSGSGVEWFSVLLKREPSLNETRLVIEARQDDGTVHSTEGVSELVIPAGWSWFSMDWKAASTGAPDGFFRLFRDGFLQSQLTALSNSSGRIGTVRLGAAGVDPETTGSFELDHFLSRIAGSIAPPP